MSVDRSLHIKSGATSKRNVLSRPERIAQMTENGEFEDGVNKPLGLRKTRVKHSKAGAKAKKEEAPAAEGAAPAGTAPAPAADAKKPDGGKKGEAKKAEGKK